ncbi:MAG: tetratricopeptide repeat protein [Actinomycetota bacterium]|nr:MAG: hypothetical protein FD171_513 [Actinomycetota bacterium]MDP3629917.1 tetratricopeptide repeat protein [Actinomycetota bacterium]
MTKRKDDAMTDRDLDSPEEIAPVGDDTEGADSGVVREEDLVPGWLALLVLVLLLAVVGLGGFVLRGVFTQDEVASPTRYAIAEWQAKVDQNPDDVENLLGLGYAYQQNGEFDKALKEYDAVIERDAQNMAAMYNKGVVLLQLGETKQAEDTLWAVLKIAPDHALAAKALGQLYIEQKHYKSTLVAVDPVVKARPELADLQFLSGYANEQLDNKAIAIERYKAALKYAPDLIEARDGLARLGGGK